MEAKITSLKRHLYEFCGALSIEEIMRNNVLIKAIEMLQRQLATYKV
ncbi:MAG: hypothetical protein AB7F43_09445 [Bacteriovoracia bacterium]